MRALHRAAYRLLARHALFRHPFATGALAGLMLFPGFAGTAPSILSSLSRLFFFSVVLGLSCWIASRRGIFAKARWRRALRFHLPILALIPVVAIPADDFPPLRQGLSLLLWGAYLWFAARSAWRRPPGLWDGWPLVKRFALVGAALCLTGIGAALLIG